MQIPRNFNYAMVWCKFRGPESRRVLFLVSILCCLIAAGCYVRHTEPREAFTIRGHVCDCITGAPIEGATILMEASSGSGMGPFSSSDAEAGNATTDADGNFAIIPYEYSSTKYFDINVSKDGRYGKRIYVNKDAILSRGGSVYDLDTLCLNP